METLKVLVLTAAIANSCCFAAVQSLQPQGPGANQQNVHPASHQTNLANSPNNPEISLEPDQTTSHYPYQSSQLAPSTYHNQPYSGSGNYGRDVYSGNRENGWGWYPYFGVNAGTAWELSAYLGPVFWCFVVIFATFGVCVTVSKFLMGGDIFGGLFQKIKDSTPAARAMDLNNITNLVYQALDTYGKFAEKDTQQGVTPNFKG